LKKSCVIITAMEMEHLTKQQIVLVTLLVSFISSIASSIVTVSLLDQAPKAVTNTIDRVIEKTVERVVPDTSSGGKNVIKETVVVSEDDAVVKAIDTGGKSVVRVVYSTGGTEVFLGFGVVSSSDGTIIAKVPDGYPNYFTKLSSGVSVPISVVHSVDENGLTVFKANSLANSVVPAVFTNSSNLKLGQKVVAIGGSENDAVSSGIISSFVTRADSNVPFRIKTSIAGQVFSANAVLVNLSGEVVGLKTGGDADEGFIPASVLSATAKR
jgi:S1-C subfamily serine protease